MKKIYINSFLYLLILFSLFSAVLIGIGWDEGALIEIARLRLNYLLSFGFVDYKPLWFSHYYPGTYPVVVMFFTKLFHESYVVEVFHIFNTLMGVSAIYGISKIAKELFNKRVGHIVFLITFFSPVFFGHMAINARDIVIAFCNIWMSYSLIKYFKFQHVERKRNKSLVVLGFLLGLGCSCRVSFFITLLPIFIFLVVDSIYQKKICKEKILIKKFFRDILISIFIAYFVLVIFWPEVYPNIFTLPFKFFYETFSGTWGVPRGLINGVIFDTTDPPLNYIFVLLFYKLPEYIILSYLIFILVLVKNSLFFKKKFTDLYYKITLIVFIIIFPNLLLLISPYPIFDNLRLFLYLIPYLSIIPAILIFYLLENLKFKINKIILTSLSILFIYFIYNFFSLTPYQYTYLNIFNGKFSESHKKFESDYWGTSIKELLKNSNFKKDNHIKLALCGMGKGHVSYVLKKNDFKNIKIVTPEENYDYIMMTNRVYFTPNIKNLKICYDHFPGNIVASVKRRGLIISLIKSNIM